MAKRVADIILDSLIASGVKRIYGVSGDSLNGITDAVRERGKEKISWIHVRHEETAGFAAGAEAHLTENLAVCAGRLWTRKYAFDKRTLRLLSQQYPSWQLLRIYQAGK